MYRVVEKAQKIIDRTVFICFCEDLDLLPEDTLSRVLKHAEETYMSSWDLMKGLFHAIDKGSTKLEIPDGYNGGLFEMDADLDSLQIGDETCRKLALLGKYDFSEDLTVNILGHIFEQSISDLEMLKQLEVGQESAEDSKRKRDGIFYTPDYIVDYIVKNSLGKYLEEKEQEALARNNVKEELKDKNYEKRLLIAYEDYQQELQKVKVLDPACGSGAFLVKVFDFLLAENKRVADTLAKMRHHKWSFFDREQALREILQNNIYGVDLNPESVEITKLSLWLKTAEKGKKLTKLNENIKCGNSLIDDPLVAGKKAFSWDDEFAEVMQGGGFDVVVGSPPYVNVELIPEKDKAYYQKAYSTFYKRFDLFGLFFELALRLSKRKAAFIIPAQILNNVAYSKLRDLILTNKHLEAVSYVGDKIFTDAKNDVCVLFLDKCGSKDITLIDALEFNNPTIVSVENDYFEKFQNVISIGSEAGTEAIFEKIFNPSFSKVDEYFDVFQGIVTGNNPLYLFDKEQLKDSQLEKELLKPVVLGKDFGKWMLRNDTRRLLYVNADTDIDSFPKAKSWLLPHKTVLEKRRECAKGVIPWYSLQWPRERQKLDITPKILVQNTRNPRLETRIVATMDEFGVYTLQSSNLVIPLSEEYSPYCLLAILNSKLINYLFRTKFLNVAIKAAYLKQTPLPPMNDKESADTEALARKMLSLYESFSKLNERFISLIRERYSLTKTSGKLERYYDHEYATFKGELKIKKLSITDEDELLSFFEKSKREAVAIKSEIDATDSLINQKVCDLYGLSPEEKLFIMNS